MRGIVPDFLGKNKSIYIEHKQKLKKRQENQKRFHDRRARDLPELQVNQNVRVQKRNGLWDRAKVIDKNINGRSYTIKTEQDKTLTRNRIHLSKDTSEPLEVKSEIYDDSQCSVSPPIVSDLAQETQETSEQLLQPPSDRIMSSQNSKTPNQIVTRSGRIV